MLTQAEANFAALIESTTDLIWSVDLEFRLLAFNHALRENIEKNYGAQIAVGMKAREFLPPERAKFWPAFYERVLKDKAFRTEYLLADGRTLEMALNPIVVDGKTTGISVFGKDITERKRAEADLRESGDFLKEAQRIGDLGCYVLDVAAGVWSSTSRLDEIFGINESYERTVAGWEALIHPNDRAMMSAYFAEEVIGRGKPFDKEYRILRKSDGAVRWVRGLGKLEFDAQHKPLKMRGIISDITAHREWEMALQESEERYRATFEQAAVGIVHASLEGKYLRCNARFAEIVGYPREEVPGLSFQQITVPEDLEVSTAMHQQLQSGIVETSITEKRYLRKDGSQIWARVTLSPQLDGEGGVLYFIAIVEDIQLRKEAEQRLAASVDALRLSEERYRGAFQTSIDAININRLSDGKYIDCNNAFLNVMGFEREEVIGKTTIELGLWVDVRDRQTMIDMVRSSASCRSMEIQFKKKNGETIWGEVSASVMDVDGVPCILSVTRDLSEYKAAKSEIRNLAYFDPLTGLPNRRLLLERLRTVKTEAQQGRSQALLLVDLDNFKTMNDTMGHPTGDLLLQQVALSIAGCVQATDTVGRLGGDEFVVMLENLSEVAEDAAAQARDVGEKILTAISQPCLLKGRECIATASIGIMVLGSELNSTGEILQQADIALHQAKAAGRNTMRFFSPALQAAVNARAEMEEDLRQAIKEKQFLLYYQPQLERGRLTGAEALIRWQHPLRGIVMPDDFIPLAEESRLILRIGDWVLKTACAQIAAWAERKKTRHLTLAVNISALQFRQPEFVEKVLKALQDTGANPKNLKLELTESILVENLEDVIHKMTELKAHGVSFSLDDFGTGYSSLAYLKRLPLDQLKIDRAFVRDMLVDVTSGAIAQAVISLGRAMGLQVMAEGVETEEQRGFLSGLGCHAFQGYLISRPLPICDFEAFL